MAHMLYQSKRLNDHLIQLLALYKEVGRPAYPFDPAPVQVSELVDQLAAQQRVLLQSKGIRLDTGYPADLIWTFDEDLVLGLLAHAINNAVRYTRDRIAITVGEQDGYMEVRVDESRTLFGVGIDADIISASLKAIVSGVTRGRGQGAKSAQSALEAA